MHGKLLILAGLAVSGGIGAAAVVGLEPNIVFRIYARGPTSYSGNPDVHSVAARLGLTDRVQCRPLGRASLRTGFRRPAVCRRSAAGASATLWLAPDGQATGLQWFQSFPDSASAAYAQDSLAALIAPGQSQLACDLGPYPRSTLAVTLLVVGNVLVTFELRGTSLGEAGYLLDLRTDRLNPTTVRFRCLHPLGPLH